MSRPCTVCLSVHAQDADALLAAGRSGRSVAAELGLSPSAVKRHALHRVGRQTAPSFAGHPAKLPAAEYGPSTANGLDPLDELVTSLRDSALGSPNAGFAREYRLALLAQAERSAERPAYDVLRDPEWLRLRRLLVAALAPYPEARQAVADAIREELS